MARGFLNLYLILDCLNVGLVVALVRWMLLCQQLSERARLLLSSTATGSISIVFYTLVACC